MKKTPQRISVISVIETQQGKKELLSVKVQGPYRLDHVITYEGNRVGNTWNVVSTFRHLMGSWWDDSFIEINDSNWEQFVDALQEKGIQQIRISEGFFDADFFKFIKQRSLPMKNKPGTYACSLQQQRQRR